MEIPKISPKCPMFCTGRSVHKTPCSQDVVIFSNILRPIKDTETVNISFESAPIPVFRYHKTDQKNLISQKIDNRSDLSILSIDY